VQASTWECGTGVEGNVQVGQGAARMLRDRGQETMAESDSNKVTPLVKIQRVTYKKLKGQIRSETHAKLTEYVAFYRKATGDTKASDGEVVGAALEWVFREDKAFIKFTSGNGATRRSAVTDGGEKGGGPTET